MTVSGVMLGHQFGIPTDFATPGRYYYWPENFEAELIGLFSLPWTNGDFG